MVGTSVAVSVRLGLLAYASENGLHIFELPAVQPRPITFKAPRDLRNLSPPCTFHPDYVPRARADADSTPVPSEGDDDTDEDEDDDHDSIGAPEGFLPPGRAASSRRLKLLRVLQRLGRRVNFRFDYGAGAAIGVMAFTDDDGEDGTPLLLVPQTRPVQAVHVVDVTQCKHGGYVCPPSTVDWPAGVAAGRGKTAVSAHDGVHLYAGRRADWTPTSVVPWPHRRRGRIDILGLRFFPDGDTIVALCAKEMEPRFMGPYPNLHGLFALDVRRGAFNPTPLLDYIMHSAVDVEVHGGHLYVSSEIVCLVDATAGTARYDMGTWHYDFNAAGMASVPGVGLFVANTANAVVVLMCTGQEQKAAAAAAAMSAMSEARMAWITTAYRAIQERLLGVPSP